MDIPQSRWSGVIDSWFERMIKCVQAEGGSSRKKKKKKKKKKAEWRGGGGGGGGEGYRVVFRVVEKPDCKT